MIEQKKLEIQDQDFQRELFGYFDQNIKIIEDELNVHTVLRDGNIVLIGENANIEKTEKLIGELFKIVKKGETLSKQKVAYSLEVMRESPAKEKQVSKLSEDIIAIGAKGNPIKPKTFGQMEYIKKIENNDITFGIGPAGTGKTYLAVAMAVRAFKRDEVNRIILTRPAVEAGESLGFLPGDLKEKIDPYLKPLYDALFEILGGEKFNNYMEKGMIEVAPLAFMRGRTLDNSFIILDEAQNTTREQMKMFLTRLGLGSKAVVTGDVTQTDLPTGKKTGLVHARQVLGDVEGIGFSILSERDVVRHSLVQRIIKAYEKFEKADEAKKQIKK
ncbi:phosphate starvation-inducible protein PhoH [Peptoclostridium litorale DSM 5388]|uniref:PhoH-like protein n=1 Tax=Peptoclostridium litorale DSM 5388 TaxID=1121324 RepID=A0A069RLL2_PEPLI|nr:PhoH family protein [Peptoclostridium litorale]KDR95082.1 PhoH-like protein PhoH [Peptoclostridium litorale DSM 5388]SIN75315.1 phosphate starvation-inducible protein PhoH [Peptoclostridium litorale DSM 5388]